jgi:hypothetical protein
MSHFKSLPAGDCPPDVAHCKRFVVNSKLVATSSYSQSFKHNNCCVATSESHAVYMLHSCIVLSICQGGNCIDHVFNEHVLLLANRTRLSPIQKLDSIGCNLTAHIQRADVSYRELVVLCAEGISHKVFHLRVDDNESLCIMLPQFELD